MIATTAQQIAYAVGGELISGDPSIAVTSVSTDTRAISDGDLFVALSGENFDAHDFLEQAVESGAKILLVSRVPQLPPSDGVVVIKCADTLAGLQALARWHRRQHPLPVVGITGSNGKTSTKDFTRSVLAQKFRVNATFGNLNNHIGLPLSVLKTTADHECCIFEMGMNHPGEIAPLCEICAPDIGIITNVGTAHIEHMGSRDAIAKEKGALGRSLTAEGTLILAAGGDYNDQLIAESPASAVIVGADNTIHARNISTAAACASFDLSIDGDIRPVTLPVAGEHMISNALLAAAAGHRLGLTIDQIAQGLTTTELTSGRMRALNAHGIAVFDDTYNANPDSVAAGMKTLAAVGLPAGALRYVVLGRMAELGEHAAQAYETTGRLAAELGLHLVTVGAEAKAMADAAAASGGKSQACDGVDDAATALKSLVTAGDAVLFKGSRLAGIERVMHATFPEI